MEYNLSTITTLFKMDNISTVVTNFSSTTSSPTTSWPSGITIEDLNTEETRRRIVPLIYLTLLAVLGIPGNILIIYIYTVKFQRKATHRTFVVAIAVSDLLVCCFTVPFELAQMTREYTFYSVGMCKLGRTLNMIFTFASAVILVALSANRYRRICQPLRMQLTVNEAGKSLIIISIMVILIAWPEGILTGLKTHHLENNLTGYDCSLSPEYEDTSYPLAYSIIVLLLYAAIMVSLFVMCILIGRQIMKSVVFRDQFRPSNLFTSFQNSNDSTTQSTANISTTGSENHDQIESQIEGQSHTTPRRSPNSPMKITRTALLVSVCFIAVFIPYIIIKILGAAKGDFLQPSVAVSIFMPLLARTHFINNVVNFMIYLKMDSSFRSHCKAIFIQIYSVGKKYLKKS